MSQSPAPSPGASARPTCSASGCGRPVSEQGGYLLTRGDEVEHQCSEECAIARYLEVSREEAAKQPRPLVQASLFA